MQNNKFFITLRNVLVILAVINLILLFGFHYELPNFIKRHLPSEEKTVTKEQDDPSTTSAHFQFDEKALTYDGSEKLDLNKGVALLNEDGNLLESTIYSSIAAGSSPTEKIITYTAEDENGTTVSAERTLILENYSGPTIDVSNAPISIMDTDLAHLKDYFKETDFVQASDGYGKDITDSVTTSYAVTNRTATELTVTFKVTNMFNDTVTKSAPITMQLTKPIIVLTDATVTLPTGSVFLAGDYIYCATNEEGEDLIDRVTVKQDVNTSEPGTYSVTYELTDADGESAAAVTLKVVVE